MSKMKIIDGNAENMMYRYWCEISSAVGLPYVYVANPILSFDVQTILYSCNWISLD